MDRLPFLGAWGSPTSLAKHAAAWEQEGMPPGTDVMVELGFDGAENPKASTGWEDTPVKLHAVPLFPTPSLPDAGPYRRFINPSSGLTYVERPADENVPHDVCTIERGPVASRADWAEYKQHFQLTPEGRYGADWDEWAEHSKTAAHPIGLRLLGLFGALCNSLGLEGDAGLLLSLHDRPAFVREMIDYMTDFNISVSEKALSESELDFVYLGDMLGDHKTTFISPAMYEDFFLEPYRRIVAHIRGHGIEMILFQARFTVNPYVSAFAELGFDGFFGTSGARDAERIHSEYGDRFAILGGIDRWLLRFGSFGDIEGEIDLAVEVAQGGRMIPTLCERVVHGTSYANYCHYARYLARQLTACQPERHAQSA